MSTILLQEVMNILVQLLLGLRHVHAHKILHRDLKAQNVFLTSSGIVKVGKVGIYGVSSPFSLLFFLVTNLVD